MNAPSARSAPASSELAKRNARARALRLGLITTVGWSAPENLEYGGWALEGKRIGLMSRVSPWWIGDWLLYGTTRWGEMYGAAARITGYDPKTLRNIRYVASRFDVSLRKDNLTWSHHALLAGLSEDRQRHWLERATGERLSVEDLRTELRNERARATPMPGRRGWAEPERSPTVTCPRCGDQIPISPTLLGS